MRTQAPRHVCGHVQLQPRRLASPFQLGGAQSGARSRSSEGPRPPAPYSPWLMPRGTVVRVVRVRVARVSESERESERGAERAREREREICACTCVCVRVRVRVCGRAGVRACVRAGGRAGVRGCARSAGATCTPLKVSLLFARVSSRRAVLRSNASTPRQARRHQRCRLCWCQGSGQ